MHDWLSCVFYAKGRFCRISLMPKHCTVPLSFVKMDSIIIIIVYTKIMQRKVYFHNEHLQQLYSSILFLFTGKRQVLTHDHALIRPAFKAADSALSHSAEPLLVTRHAGNARHPPPTPLRHAERSLLHSTVLLHQLHAALCIVQVHISSWNVSAALHLRVDSL